MERHARGGERGGGGRGGDTQRNEGRTKEMREKEEVTHAGLALDTAGLEPSVTRGTKKGRMLYLPPNLSMQQTTPI